MNNPHADLIAEAENVTLQDVIGEPDSAHGWMKRAITLLRAHQPQPQPGDGKLANDLDEIAIYSFATTHTDRANIIRQAALRLRELTIGSGSGVSASSDTTVHAGAGKDGAPSPDAPSHPLSFPDSRGGANGMKAGDRVVYTDGRHGRADEFLQGGEAFVTFDDGKYESVNWNHLSPESEITEIRLVCPTCKSGTTITGTAIEAGRGDVLSKIDLDTRLRLMSDDELTSEEWQIGFDIVMAHDTARRATVDSQAEELRQAEEDRDFEAEKLNQAKADLASQAERIGELESADSVVREIERLVPDWKSYRNLVDALTCKLQDIDAKRLMEISERHNRRAETAEADLSTAQAALSTCREDNKSLYDQGLHNCREGEKWKQSAATAQTMNDKLTGVATKLSQQLHALIEESEGVAGLHLNGNLAPWHTLIIEGEFEDWLDGLFYLDDCLATTSPVDLGAGTVGRVLPEALKAAESILCRSLHITTNDNGNRPTTTTRGALKLVRDVLSSPLLIHSIKAETVVSAACRFIRFASHPEGDDETFGVLETVVKEYEAALASPVDLDAEES